MAEAIELTDEIQKYDTQLKTVQCQIAFRTSFTVRCSYFLAEMILKYSFIYSSGYTLYHLSFLLGSYLSKIGNNCYFSEASEQTCYVYLFQVGETSSHAELSHAVLRRHIPAQNSNKATWLQEFTASINVYLVVCVQSIGICLYYHGSYMKSLLSSL